VSGEGWIGRRGELFPDVSTAERLSYTEQRDTASISTLALDWGCFLFATGQQRASGLYDYKVGGIYFAPIFSTEKEGI
jgi:hypothetical protein